MDIQEFRRLYDTVDKLQLILDIVPDFHWCLLYKIKTMAIVSDYDYEEWKPTHNIVMELMTSGKKRSVRLLFKHIYEFRLLTADAISGFEIIPYDDHGFGDKYNYLIGDYEENQIHFLCKSIHALRVSKL